MTDERQRLLEAVRQLVETELLLGGDFLPRRRNELPEPGHASSPAAGADSSGALDPRQKAQALAALEAQHVQECANCGLRRSCSRIVFGEGRPDAEIVFVGEAPGEEEDRQGRPFVGRAGQLLDRMIAAMGLRRRDVYICNMVKCRPPGNRTPTPEEVAACWSYLVRQLQIIGPKVIVTLGNPATQGLLNIKTGITQLRGQWQKLPAIGQGLEGIPVMPTFHPAYVLRQYNQETRGKVWDDLQKVMKLLGLKMPQRPAEGPDRLS